MNQLELAIDNPLAAWIEIGELPHVVRLLEAQRVATRFAEVGSELANDCQRFERVFLAYDNSQPGQQGQ